MIRVNVFQLKARLSEYLKKVDAGEHVVICRHNTPMATLSRVSEARTTMRVVGPMPGAPVFEVAGSFFEPLPDDELAAWDGHQPTRPRPVKAQPKPTPSSRTKAKQAGGRASKSSRKASRRHA